MSCNKPMKSAAFGNFACGAMIQGGLRLCEDCLRIHRANVEFLGQTKPAEKRDFENLDTRLYLALVALRKAVDEEHPEWVSHSAIQPAWAAAGMVMLDFEDSHGPLPEWAVARNFGYELLPGAQLCTKDGRRTGNAHIVSIEVKEYKHLADRNNPCGEVTVYNCLTDAGSHFAFTAEELETAFTIGEWLSSPERILKVFDRHGHFTEEPL